MSEGNNTGLREERGQSNLVAIVLLFGMVFMGATIIFLSAGVLIDGLEGQAGAEQIRSTMGSINHDMWTAASGDGIYELPDGDISTTDNGNISVAWYNGSESHDDNFTDENTSSLGELRLESAETDTVLVHQGGGVWEVNGDGVGIRSAPEIGFSSGGSLQLNVMQIDASEGTPSRIEGNGTKASEEIEQLTRIAQNPTSENFAVRIESEHADGWERHFNNEKAGVDRAGDVNVTRNGDIVTLEIEEIGDTGPDSYFSIEGDHGIESQNRNIENSILSDSVQHFRFNQTIRNVGNEPAKANVTFSVWDGDEEVENLRFESENQIGPEEELYTAAGSEWGGMNSNNAFHIQLQSGNHNLTPGTRYEYDVETDPGGDTLSQRGVFYYLDEGWHYVVEETSTSSAGATEKDIEAVVRNLGDEDGDEENVTLEVSPVDGNATGTTNTTVNLDSTESATVTWTIDETEWANGEYEYTVRTADDDTGESGTFTVTNGGAFEISEDLGISEADRVEGAGGQVITNDGSVQISANITSDYTDQQSQDITLEVFDTDGESVDISETKEDVTLNSNERRTVNITVPVSSLEDGTVYQYDIASEDDSLNGLGSFLVVNEPAEVTIESASASGQVQPGDSLTVEATVTNEGEAGEEFVWLEGFDGSIVDITEVEFDENETKNVTFEWSNVAVPGSSNETDVTVGTVGDSASAAVDLEPLLVINEVDVDNPVGQGDTATVEAEVESLGGATTQEVVLEGFDGTVADSTELDVSGTQTVTFEYETAGDAVTDRVGVRTDDDEMNAVVVIDRDAPDCDGVAFEGGNGNSQNPYQISNVDQLQCINEDPNAHYELTDNIDAHGTRYWNVDGNDAEGFEPIGTGSEGRFTGSLDGNGNKIEGLYINRPEEADVGLIGLTNSIGSGTGAVTVSHLRVEDAEIYGDRHVGAVGGNFGGTIEDVSADGYVEANQQRVGLVVGRAAGADLTNRLVATGEVRGGDASSVHRGIGAIVGRTSWDTEVDTGYAQATVIGDKNVGGFMGSSSTNPSEFEQMYAATDVRSTADNDATAGAITGLIESGDDVFKDSVYWDVNVQEDAYGAHDRGGSNAVNEMIGRSTENMQGTDVNQPGKLGNLEFEEEGGPWVAIPDDYPRFAWELEAEGAFRVEITSVENVSAGEAATVNATVTSLYQDSDESNVTQTIGLTNHDGRTVDTKSVTLPSTLGENEEKQISLEWQTDLGDSGVDDITVRSEDMEAAAPLEVTSGEFEPGDPGGPTPGDLIDNDPAHGGGSDVGPGTTGGGLSQQRTDIDVNVGSVAVS